jgi:cyclopropane fatty-acyl-phospholipid synthase-like methyltransferase
MSTEEIARYYDRNTSRFLAFGRGGRSYAIHRELWGAGISTPAQAAAHLNVRVADRLGALEIGPDATILDLGCGVGGTLLELAERFPSANLVGVTVSARQVEIGRRLVAERGLGGRCRIVLGDFQTVFPGARSNAAVAIESFTHADSPSRFVAAAAGHVAPRGVLVVVDDFVDEDGAARRVPNAAFRLDQLRRGWRLRSLCASTTLVDAAAREGFDLMSDEDLTPLVRLGRPRDRLIALGAPLFEALGLVAVPLFGNMIGGNALQIGLRDGFLRYRMMTFRRRA